jgi:general secretion pathway protein M
MKEYWLGLQSRERLLLIVCAVCLLIFIVDTQIWVPQMERYERNQQLVNAKKNLYDWMKDASKQAIQLQKTAPTSNRSRSKQSLIALTDKTAKQAALGKSIKRVEPQGKDTVRIWLENANFKQVTLWLQRMQNLGISLDRIVIDSTDESGLVNVRATFKREQK